MNLTLQEAKERVRISDLWREFGYEGEPKKQCRCPFHEDRTPSFSVFDEGRKWKCFSGCGEGSVIDFLVLAKGISEEEACKEVLRRADANDCSPPIRRESPRPKSLELPALFPYSKDIAQQVADSRGVSITALEFASLWLKTVVFGRVCDQDCWILTDASCRCADARRIVREPFPPLGELEERKGHSLRGSNKSWPVGVSPAGFEELWLNAHVHQVLLVEGAPDYLAACQLIAAQDENVLPVVMLGAGTTIDRDALPHFVNRRVIIVGHPDEAGRAAALRWAAQIQEGGGVVRAVQLKKGDLCDLVAAGATHNDLRLF
jgi:hypothetical protein